jgi:hypothetical protein
MPDAGLTSPAEPATGALADDHDAFGHRDYAIAAAELLLDYEAPLTMGLFGPWGVGKTWVIEEIGRAIGKRAAFAYFDVWRYEGDALRRQFLRDLAIQLHPSEVDFDPKKELTDLEEGKATKKEGFGGLSKVSLGETLIRVALAGVMAFLLLSVAGSSWITDKHGTLRDVAVSGAISVMLFALTPLTRVLRITEETLTRSRLEDPEHFTERFEALLAKLKKKRLVVAIDNLDRCAPDRVEELLSTIKTYLEPVTQMRRGWLLSRMFRRPATREAVFLIAADDDALRRHLEAKEAAASGTERDPKEIARYVDEYLRKFFTVAVRIRPLLDDDVRSYADDQLAEFSQANGLNDETRLALVEMVAAALGRNPRRIKQFGRNLDARLRVIRQREREKRIQPPISDQVLVIGKLAILEEEWPDSFRALQDDPRVLARWHRQVVEGSQASSPDGKDEAFGRFLSTSREIAADNLSAFIRLKQSRQEIRLPRYADFRDALVQGDVGLVEEVVESDRERAAEYARELPGILEEELRHRYLDGARGVVDAATSVDLLSQNHAAVRAVLRRAVADSELRLRLTGVRPRLLFLAARELSEADRIRLFVPFLELQQLAAESVASLELVLEAFAEIADDLPPATQTTLKEALAGELITPHLDLALPLGRANANLIPDQMATAAFAALQASFDVNGAAYELLLLWFGRNGADSTHVAELLDLAADEIASFVDAATEPEIGDAKIAMAQLSEDFVELQGVGPDDVSTFMSTIDLPITRWPPATWPDLLDVVGAAATLSQENATPDVLRFVTEFFAGAEADATQWASERGESLAESLLEPVVDRLIALANASETRAAAMDALVKIDPAGSRGYLLRALRQLLTWQLFASAQQYTRRHPAIVASHMDELINLALHQAEAPTADGVLERALTFFGGFVKEMSNDQRAALKGIVAAKLSGAEPQTVEAVRLGIRPLAKAGEFQTEMREVAATAFADLKAESPPSTAIVTLVAEHIRFLSSSERSAFVTLMSRLIAESEDRGGILEAVKQLPEVDPSQRESIVKALIDTEVLESEIDKRVELLRVADLVATKRGNARKLVTKRLEELAGRADDDLTVYTMATAADDSPEPPSD